MNPSDIKEHLPVLGSDGGHVGTVDHMDGTDRIKLTKNDPTAGGEHHFIPLAWVARVDEHVHLNKPTTEARAEWQGQDAK